MRVKNKDENSMLCRNCSDVSLAMGLPTSTNKWEQTNIVYKFN